jgi:hypothetical protein
LIGNIANSQQTFCIPILSGIVGLGADKMLPIGLLHDDIRLEFTLESNTIGMVFQNASTTAWSIVDFQLELAIIELSDEGENMVRSMTPPERPIFLHGNSWRHYTSSLTSGYSGTFSTLVPARFASLKSLVCLPRRATEVTSATSYSLSSRVNPNIDQYWWRIGSALYPNRPVVLANSNSTGAYAEAFAEIIKSFHSINSVDVASCCINSYYNTTETASTTYNVAGVSTGSLSFQNAFAIAQELESFANRGDLLLSGINTLSNQIFHEFTISTATAAAYTIDYYANFDAIFVLVDGILSVKF